MRIISTISALMMLIGANVGCVKVLIFLWHQWGIWGIAAFFTFVPPVFICPIWEWVVTGSWWTFFFVYVLFFGGAAIRKFSGDEV